MAGGKISPADIVRQRRPTSQPAICCCSMAVNLRGSNWAETPAAEPARPAAPTNKAVSVTPKRQPPRPRPAGATVTSVPGGPGCVATAEMLRPGQAVPGSVRGQRRVYLADPGQHSPANMHRVREPGVLDDGQALGAAGSALAVQHDPAVLRELLERRPVKELILGNENGSRDRDDLVLVRLPDVHEENLLVGVEHGLQLGRGDRRPGRRAL